MSTETPAERRLRILHDNAAAFGFIDRTADAAAIDAGREALALIRAGVESLGSGDSSATQARIDAARALLARCTETP